MTGWVGPGLAVRSARGVALITVLVVTSLVFVIALGLSLVVSTHHLSVRNHREAVQLLFAARAGVELAADGLAAGDWNAVLAGLVWSPAADGSPTGTRALTGGGSVDLAGETHRLTCGSPLPCSVADEQAITRDRSWGANNPRWRLYLFGPLSTLAPLQFPAAAYLLVWVADDGREADGMPEVDGGAGGRGQGVLRVRARALGGGGARRDVEAEVVRICRPGPEGVPCRPGLRVHGLRDIRQSIP